MKSKILLLLVVLLIPVSARAYTCSDSDAARLRKLASNVTASYDYQEYDDYATFSVTLTNLNNDIYIVDSTNGKTYYYDGNNEITIDGYTPGTNIKYYIYNTRSDCVSGYLTIKYVNLPYYNKYYKSEICQNNTNSLCYKWKNVTISYDELVKQLTTNKSEEIVEEENNNDNIAEAILDFINEYYGYIMGVLILTFILTELLRKRDSFDL